MDANGLKFWMLSKQQDWSVPPPPAVPGSSAAAPNMSSLAQNVGVDDTQIVLLVALPGGAPEFISVDSEVMSVSGIDATGLQLGVIRGARGTTATNHPPGALVLGPVGILRADAAVTDTQLTIVAAHTSPGYDCSGNYPAGSDDHTEPHNHARTSTTGPGNGSSSRRLFADRRRGFDRHTGRLRRE